MSEVNTVRHTACVECRQRKVRCDGGQPYCQNCSRRGSDCVYARNAGQDKQEMMEMIRSITKRLSQAEESIITTRRYQPATSPNTFWPENPAAPICLDLSSAHANEFMPLDDSWALFANTQWTTPELPSLESPSENNSSSLAPIHGNSPLSSQAMDVMYDDEELAPPHLLHQLCAKYFEKGHHEYFMMSHDSFLSRIQDSLSGLETQSLRLIVLAHGASISSPHNHLSRRFYELSRKRFGQVELGKGFLTITALQSCILLALFELKEALFTRAWTSVSRVNWMVQMFALQKMDGDSPSLPNKLDNLYPLPPAMHARDVEERRRTYWSAFNLSCFASIGAGWKTYVPVHYADITTLLPSENFPGSPSGLSLYDAFRMAGSETLTASQVLILTNALCGRCLAHINYTVSERGSDYKEYDFWMHHCHIIESTMHMASTSLSSFSGTSNDPSTLCINISLQAILVCLHNAGAIRVARTNATQPPNAYSETNCQRAALEIAKLTRITMGSIELVNMSPFIPWSIYVAAQACIRALQSNSITNQSQCASQRDSSSSRPSSSSSSSLFDFWVVPPATTEGTAASRTNGLVKAPRFDRTAQAEPPASRTTLSDALECLMDALGSFKHFSPVSRVFEAELRDELKSGKLATDDLLIGFVNFPLHGQNFV